MRRLRNGFAWVGLAFLALSIAGAVAFVRRGISARPEPSRAETRVARALRHQLIPSHARSATNPVPATPEAVAAGLEHYADHCSSCHANDGSGRTPLGEGLYPRPPDLRSRATQDLSDGELFWIIENGVRLTGMPAWGEPGSEEESWRLVHFIRHLPELTPGERIRMGGLNPRSPEEWRRLQADEEFLRGAPEAGRDPAYHAR